MVRAEDGMLWDLEGISSAEVLKTQIIVLFRPRVAHFMFDLDLKNWAHPLKTLQ